MPRTKPSVDLGPRLRDLCVTRQVSTAELARRTGLGPNILRRILRGERPVKSDERRLLLRALELKAKDLAPEPTQPAPTANQLEQERDDLHAQVDALRKELAAAHEALARELAELQARPSPVDPEHEELRAQVDTLRAELAAARTAHSAELAELRDRHLRELAELRTRFHEEQVAALGEGQEREEKLAAALSVMLAELDRRHPPTPPRPDPSPPPPPEPATPIPTDKNLSVAGTLASLAVGLGSVAFGTWLLNSRKS